MQGDAREGKENIGEPPAQGNTECSQDQKFSQGCSYLYNVCAFSISFVDLCSWFQILQCPSLIPTEDVPHFYIFPKKKKD